MTEETEDYKRGYAKGADSWEARLPSYKGKITARIGRHYFYKQEQKK